MTKPVTGQTTFGASTSGTTTQLDNNFLLCINALNDLNTYSNFLTDTGTANAYAASLAANLTGPLTDGLIVQLKVVNANTGASTFAYNGGGALNIKTVAGSALTAGQMPASSIVQLQYRASDTSWLLQTPAPSSGGITLGTPVASTSGTTVNFTGIPAGTKRVVVSFIGVSTSGSSGIMIQIGPTGGLEATGYLGCATICNASGAATQFTTGFGLCTWQAAADILHGNATLCLENSSNNTWSASGMLSSSSSTNLGVGSGSKSLAGALSKLTITMVNGTDTFDAGEINIQYE